MDRHVTTVGLRRAESHRAHLGVGQAAGRPGWRAPGAAAPVAGSQHGHDTLRASPGPGPWDTRPELLSWHLGNALGGFQASGRVQSSGRNDQLVLVMATDGSWSWRRVITDHLSPPHPTRRHAHGSHLLPTGGARAQQCCRVCRMTCMSLAPVVERAVPNAWGNECGCCRRHGRPRPSTHLSLAGSALADSVQ